METTKIATHHSLSWLVVILAIISLIIIQFSNSLNNSVLWSNLNKIGLNEEKNHISLSSRFRWNGNPNHVIVSRLISDGESASLISSMTDFFNKMYTGSLSIGTPFQSFDNIVFDTGSADLWVMNEKYKGNGIPSKSYLKYFNTNDSTTYKKFNQIETSVSSNYWHITYGTGNATGISSFDTITFGKNMTVTSQVFAVASKINSMSISSYEPQNGICGFARKQAGYWHKYGYTPIMETLYTDGVNNNNYFAFYLSQHGDSGSKLIIGDKAIDNNYFDKNSLYWYNVNDNSGYSVKGLWTILINNIVITDYHNSDDNESKNKMYSMNSEQYAILDTGTSYIGIPSYSYDTVMKWITKYRNDCNKQSLSSTNTYLCTDTVNPYKNLPNFEIILTDINNNNNTLILTPQQYMDDDGQLAFMSITLKSSQRVAINNLWIFGDTFLKNFYSVFDDNNSKIGLAKAKLKDNQTEKFIQECIIIVSVILAILISSVIFRWFLMRKQIR